MWVLLLVLPCSFTHASQLPSTCSDAVVGGGWSGVYFLYRRALASADPSSLCLFEASQRIGGRTYSVFPSTLGTEDFTLDVGAYRFSPDMHLPGDLILHDLRLPTACYEPSCPTAKADFPPPFLFNYTAPLRRIVNATTGLPAGYATALHTMLARLKPLGVRVILGAEVVDAKPAATAASGEGTGTVLTFKGGATVHATGAVLLNLPRNRLLMLPSLVATVAPRTLGMLRCVAFDAPKSLFQNHSIGSATGLTKAYAYYDDAWWYTRLNHTSGQWPANAFLPLPTSYGVWVGIHWNDGPVLCASPTADGPASSRASSFLPVAGQALPNGARCHGYLEMYYAAQNETFYYDLSGAPAEPLGIVHDAPPYEHAALEKAHAALLEAIAPLLKQSGVPANSLPPPTELVVGAWSRPGVIKRDTGYTAPTKVYWSPSISGSVANACGVDGLTDSEYRQSVLQPFGRHVPIYLANNDFVAQDVTYFYGDWAEESLLQCERALHRLGMGRPAWLNATYYAQKIAGLA